MISTQLFNRLLRRLDLERREAAILARMGFLVGALFAAYTLAKVLRDSLFISAFGARALPYGYLGVAAATVGLIRMEPLLARHLPRIGVVAFTQLSAIGCCVVAALILPLDPAWLAAGFYVWAGSQGMMLVSHFWTLAHEVWDDARRARRVFPLLVGSGLAGGVIGGGFASLATPYVGLVGLVWSLAGLLVLVRFLTAGLAARHHFRSLAGQQSREQESRLRVVMSSPLLRYLVASLALSVLASTLVDFQFKQLAQQVYPGRQALTQFLGAFHAGLDGLAMVAQFGIAGWLLRHAGIGVANSLQPCSVLLFSAWMVLSPIWAVVLVLRWIQGVVVQTVGKSVAEIHFMALRPSERRRVRSAIDVIVERGADASAGLLLILLLDVMGAGPELLAGLTFLLGTTWLVVGLRLRREYTRAFRDRLAGSWVDSGLGMHTVEVPAAREALLRALESGEEPRIVAALEILIVGSDRDLNQAVSSCLDHPSPQVRAAAVRTMEARGLKDQRDVIQSFLSEKDEEVRRAAVQYLLSLGPDPSGFARQLLENDDPDLRRHVLDVLVARPYLAPAGALTLAWVDRCVESGASEDLVAAGRALSLLGGPGAVQRLSLLLRHHHLEVQRHALRSVAARPAKELLEAVLSLLFVPELAYEVREALAAIGHAGVPQLENLAMNSQDPRVRTIAAHALGRIGTPAAIGVLSSLARSQDPGARYLGLRNLNRIRRDLGRPVIARSLAHRMFQRELADYRGSIDRALVLESRQEPEVRLLAESYRESADRALARALRALACWYEPAPLEGAFQGLHSGEREKMGRGIEYLSGILPRRKLSTMLAFFEGRSSRAPEDTAFGPREVAECVWRAWETGDAWLRACAVRAARVVPGMELTAFTPSDTDDALVTAELLSLGIVKGGEAIPGQAPDEAAAAASSPC